ncbi:MAG TPA: hypothetical protein VGJ20_16665 [Xanthobacteraceae bacterium]
MRIIVVIAAAVASVATIAGSATAATKKHSVVIPTTQNQNVVIRSARGTVIQPTRTIIHNANGTTTVIVVPRRSYLDVGTEVSVGDGSFRDYMLPPNGDPGRPFWYYGPNLTGHGYPMVGPFYLPGFNPNTPF